ncbi:MAG: DUF3592 domain-containing protein [Gemmatimonadetes bacterium]|nr:MAG: DUF3592 domain-containing protein [Gemmatimonadota bacterium]
MKQSEQHGSEILIAVLAAVIFMMVGIVSVYFGTYFYNDIQSVRKQGLKTEGVLLRYEQRGTSASNMKDMFVVPIVQFKTRTGETFVVEGKIDNTDVLQSICDGGDRIEVIYDPKNPEHVVINTFAELWFVPLLLWVVGSGFIVVPPFTIWRHYKAKTS